MNAAQGHFQTTTPSGGIWHSLNRLLAVLILVGIAGVVAIHFNPELAKRRAQRAILDQLKVEVEAARQEFARNSREEYLLAHDPEYLAIIARDRLDLMKEGEMIYRLEAPRVEKAKMRLNRRGRGKVEC